MSFPGFSQRLQDLEDNIERDLKLLKECEEELSYTRDPIDRARYLRDIKRQEESVAKYQQEYNQIKQQFSAQSAQIKRVKSLLQQMDAKLDHLSSGQKVIYGSLSQTRQALLDRYDATEQATINQITQAFQEYQLILTQKLLDAVETNQVSAQQMQQMLVAIEQRLPALPPSQAESVAEIINNPELDFRHRLKVALPIIPTLVEYEAEMELGTGFKIKEVWEQIERRLQRR